MKINRISSSALIVTAIVLCNCTLLKKESPSKKAREFMVMFQQNLNKPDEEILKFFETDKSAETILSAINLFQNEDNSLVTCIADFDLMDLQVQEIEESFRSMFKEQVNVVRVSIPFTVQPKDGGESKSINVVLWLREKDSQFKIVMLEGDELYSTFTAMKHEIQYAKDQEEEIRNRQAIYALADTLDNKYDSVVWYAVYNDEPYFYVINGTWSEEFLTSRDTPRPDFRMGLVNSSGKEILPVEFEMVGTIGAEIENAVEAKGANGYGYFSLTGDTLVPPDYTQIIPYQTNNQWIVQNGSEIGWINKQKEFVPGFPNNAIKESYEKYEYLPSGISINEGTYTLCESTHQENAGSGTFITPSYWVEAGLLESFKTGISKTVTDAPIGGWTQYIELSETFFKSISESFGVVVTTFKERYLEGRSEFYEHKKILFKDSLQNTLLTQEFSSDEMEVKLVSDGVVEVKTTEGFDEEYYDEPTEGEFQGRNYYRYYSYGEGAMQILESNRSHPETEFVKLDDSYLAGTFRVYHSQGSNWEEVSTYPVSELIKMRNEILASYGVIFKDAENKEYFQQFNWYQPRYNSEAEIKDQLNEIDQHNLKFLNKAIRNQQTNRSI